MSLSIGTDLTQRIIGALNDPANVVPSGIAKEEHFERYFVEPTVKQALAEHAPQLHIALHPWVPQGIRVAVLDEETKIRKRQWKDSKKWSVARAWGTHTPDIAIRDPDNNDSMVIEVKFAAVSGKGLNTGELQRMVGQCVLARLHHKAVIGVFGYRGVMSRKDEIKLEEWLLKQGINLVLREVPVLNSG